MDVRLEIVKGHKSLFNLGLISVFLIQDLACIDRTETELETIATEGLCVLGMATAVKIYRDSIAQHENRFFQVYFS